MVFQFQKAEKSDEIRRRWPWRAFRLTFLKYIEKFERPISPNPEEPSLTRGFIGQKGKLQNSGVGVAFSRDNSPVGKPKPSTFQERLG